MYLSLIIPAYKEAARIAASLDKIFSYFATASYEVEVIVVDDGSPDNSVEVIRNAFAKNSAGHLKARLIEMGTNGGKGSAVRAGMLNAKGAIRIFTDADL